LPVGSSFDQAAGTFVWQPGPGFLGEYRFVFVDRTEGVKSFVTVLVRPKT
jgi:hypothetical protein